ncbi:MAG: Ig-like domain-containing domain [Armatimonadota bacterium]
MRRILFAAILCLLFAPSMVVYGVGLPAGTEIQLQATGEYVNDLDESQTSTPASLTLTVVQVAGVAIDWNVAQDTITQGEYAYFPVMITNTGNATDNFTLSASSTNGWVVDFVYDEDNDGVHDASETWVISAPPNPIDNDGYSPCFLRVLIPDGASDSDTVTVTATSMFNAVQGTDSEEIHVPAPGLNSTRLTASASPDFPYVGQDVTVSGQLQPPMAMPIRFTLVTPEGNISSSTAATGQDGSFQKVFNASLAGTYEVAIDFDGGSGYDACSTTASITAQEKIASSIDLACSPAAPAVGDSVTITGTLTPALQAAVDITCTMPSGSSTQHHLTTDAGGTFTWNTTLDTAGQWYFQAVYAGDDSHASCSKLLTVQATVPAEPEHTVMIGAGPLATPSAVDSQGSTQCSVSAIDSLDHQINYHWSDGGAGGTFVPSADIPLPVYTAAANNTGQDITVTLTCAAMCAIDNQVSDSKTTQLTVYTVDTTPPQVVSVTPTDGAQCVGLSANIVVKFSKAMDHSSTETAVNLTPALDTPQYVWSADSKTLTITHVDMTPGMDYVAAVTTAAVAANSTAMQQDYVWAFTTTSGAWFDPSEMTAETDKEFVTPHLVLNVSEATTFTAFIGVPDSLGIDTAMSGDGLACVEAGADVTSLSSSWDPTNREISITAQVPNPGASTEILKGITLTAPGITGSAQITIDGCTALDVTIAAPLPGDFNGDHAVNISDAADFVGEWIRWHGATIPVWSDATDSKFDLAPHTDGVWPNWTPQGDQSIDILDATAFIDCWIGSHAGGLSSVAYAPMEQSWSYAQTLASSSEIVVTVDDAPADMFEIEVQLPSGARFFPVKDDYGNLRNVIRSTGTGGLLFSEYDAKKGAVRLAGSVCGARPYRVAVIRLGR